MLWMPEEGEYRNLVTGEADEFQTFELSAWDFRWYMH